MPRLTVLDGSIGHLLKSRDIESLVSKGIKYEDLFAAAALANSARPDVVRQLHQEYVDAGADVLTSNSFACTKHAMGKIGLVDQALELAEASARIAKDVAMGAGASVQVAGSLPPLMESYRSGAQAEFEMLQPEYRQLAAALAPHVDLFLCETLSTVAEGLAAGTAAADSGKPFWVSWTIEDNTKALLRSGEPLQDAVAAVAGLPGLEAVLVNCCAPQAVTAALPVLRAAAPARLRVGGYANGFRTTTSEWLGEGSSDRGAVLTPPPEEYGSDGTILPEAYAAHARRWVTLGATIVGGCCGTGPQHITKLTELAEQIGTG